MSNHHCVTAVRKSKGVHTDEGRYRMRSLLSRGWQKSVRIRIA